MARRIKRDGKVDLAVIPNLFPWLRERVATLKEHPELLNLRDDIATLTALRDLVVSGTVEMDMPDLTRLLAVITQVKANAVKAMMIEGRSVVPIENVQRMSRIFIDLFKKYVPADDHRAFLEELRLETRHDEPVA